MLLFWLAALQIYALNHKKTGAGEWIKASHHLYKLHIT